MTDKEKIRKEFKKRKDSCPKIKLDLRTEVNIAYYDGKETAYDEVVSFIGSLQEEPVSEDLEEAAKRYATEGDEISGLYIIDVEVDAFKAGAKWQENHLWKSADGDDLPEIDREVVVLVQDYPDDKVHLRVAFAHRPNKYAKVWNSDLGEEQTIEIERHGKGEWNVPDVKFWLNVELPKEIEL